MALDRTFVHHDGKGKSWMSLRFLHQGERRVIAGSSLSVPVDDDAINTTANHVLNLSRDLR